MKCSKKIELRLCIKWARHFLVEGVKVKIFVTHAQQVRLVFSFESWTVGSQWIFLHEMELKSEKYWQTAMNMTGP